MKLLHPLTLVPIAAIALSSCDWMPGKPDPADAWQPHDSITDFNDLYNTNCRGCHGIDGTIAGSISLDQATYLSVVPKERLIHVTAKGVPGSNMPGFSHEVGGMLTDKQIEIIVDTLLSRKKDDPGPMPPYSAPLGNVSAGSASFGVFCASCHGQDGTGGSAGSVVAAAYLGMVSDQYLRTIVIAGRPELGCPDFRSRVPGKPMSDSDISDVTAWLASNRQTEFGVKEGPGSQLPVEDSTDAVDAELTTPASSPTPSAQQSTTTEPPHGVE